MVAHRVEAAAGWDRPGLHHPRETTMPDLMMVEIPRAAGATTVNLSGAYTPL
jgi:hypothetical protein